MFSMDGVSWNRRAILLGVAASAVVAAACGRAFIAPDVTPELVRIAEAQTPAPTEASLEEGRQLFVSNCNKCHMLPTPKSRSVAKWHKIIIRMARNAKLTDAQRETTLGYILAVRALPAATAN